MAGLLQEKNCPVERRPHVQMEVTFGQFSLSEGLPISQKGATADGEVRWNHRWDAPAGFRERQQLNEQGRRQTLLRRPGDS